MIGYRYSVTNLDSNKIVGSGFFKLSTKISEPELIFFLHEFTNGIYQNKNSLSILIFQASE